MTSRTTNPSPQKQLSLLWISVFVAGWLAACAGHPSLLNSERIEQTFGSYGVEVVQQDQWRRESSLYSGSGDDRVTRTWAVVEFLDPTQAEYRSEHAAILAGASIGATFRQAGWHIRKESSVIEEITVPAGDAELGARMHIELPAELAVWKYRFVVSKGGRSFDYARITEIYHPGYLKLEDLEEIAVD